MITKSAAFYVSMVTGIILSGIRQAECKYEQMEIFPVAFDAVFVWVSVILLTCE